MNELPPTDEISLRDLYLVLHRWRRVILGVTLGAALLVFVVSQLLPKTFTSTVVVSLNLNAQSNQQGLLNNLPSLPGLAQGFVDLQSTTLLSEDLKAANPSQYYKAKFDDKRGLLNLIAVGTNPAEAKERADRLLNVLRKYLRERMVDGVSSNTRAALTQTQLDVEAARKSLQRIQEELKSFASSGRSDATLAAGLEARQVDPQSARANSPAYTSLSLDESRLRSQVAQMEARTDTLKQLLNQPDSINQLVGQALLVQVLVPPAEPLRPTFPRPLLFTAIAGILGFLFSILWAFIAEAIRPKDAPLNANGISQL